MGSLKKKMGLKGKTKPGEMIARMNEMKAGAASGVGRTEKANMKKYKKMKKEPKKKEMKSKPQGKGIVKALGQKGTTGNFKKIEAKEGKGAAIGALMNKLAKHRSEKVSYGGKKKR